MYEWFNDKQIDLNMILSLVMLSPYLVEHCTKKLKDNLWNEKWMKAICGWRIMSREFKWHVVQSCL